MKIHEDDTTTIWECDAEECRAQASNGYPVISDRRPSYDWAVVKRHADTYHFCFSHGIDLFKHVPLKERL